MLRVTPEMIDLIEQGTRPGYKVKVYFEEPETYTEEDYLISVEGLRTEMSDESGYEIANTTVILKNDDYYFSRRFARELPVRKLVEIYMSIGTTEVMVFRGIVSNWALTETTLTLNINA